ncbi:MAG: type III glutamate--ammonia ligase [Hyphomicrobium sp.]|jgi:glutamine synthetase|uniref:type III glutamate--ammonia ligase n=1 Tax=Hyphomicrobium sp. TaxID=82 RepID=UPI0025C50B59|nr:type III glutamate--ammonia ligase [Hyphomicrobium sp.]MBX9861443.1 type III glutamate--ammonia ligase [Hyphomicrobium sp.]
MTTVTDSAIATLMKKLESAGVKFMLPSYVDMHGVSKTKVVPLAHLQDMVDGSELCTGAALDGVPQDVSDEEVSSHPDIRSATVLPWANDVAWFASDLWCGGQPFEPCSRNILQRQLAKADEMGYGVNLGIEAEFFVLKDDEKIGFKPLSDRQNLAKPAYDVSRCMDNSGWLFELVNAMNDLGWDVYSLDHEDGIGQFEIDFRHADALTMADRFTFFRLMAHEIARKHGGFATFMPKPYADRAGSGAHFNMSLSDKATGKNLFVAKDDPRGCKLGELGYHYIAGILKHLPAISAVVAPTVNSYKRLVLKGSMSGFTWAPVFLCYGNNNRTNTVRVPKSGGRVELRVADSACNPYLGAALTIAAGLEGVRDRLDPGEPHKDNMYLKTPEELAALGVSQLPGSLSEALDAFEANPLCKQVFGDAMFKSWLEFKREEWHSYTNHISEWEVKRYLKFF